MADEEQHGFNGSSLVADVEMTHDEDSSELSHQDEDIQEYMDIDTQLRIMEEQAKQEDLENQLLLVKEHTKQVTSPPS